MREAIHLYFLDEVVQLNELRWVVRLVADVVGIWGNSTEDEGLDCLELDNLDAELLRQTDKDLVFESHVFELLVSWEVI